jgi:hypothetical protein
VTGESYERRQERDQAVVGEKLSGETECPSDYRFALREKSGRESPQRARELKCPTALCLELVPRCAPKADL